MRLKKSKKVRITVSESLSRVIRDSSNGSSDYWLLTWRAEELYNQGKLLIDLTNSKQQKVYCHKNKNEPKFK